MSAAVVMHTVVDSNWAVSGPAAAYLMLEPLQCADRPFGRRAERSAWSRRGGYCAGVVLLCGGAVQLGCDPDSGSRDDGEHDRNGCQAPAQAGVMVAVGGVCASGNAPSRLPWCLVAIPAQSDPRDDRLFDNDLLVRGRLLFLRRSGRVLLSRDGEHIGVGSRRRLVSLTVAAGIKTSPESLAHGWRCRGRRVAPTENNGLLVVLRRWSIGRRSGGGAAGDVSGQPLGLIPLLGSRGARPVGLVVMQAADARELWRLVRSASSPARFGTHGGGEYVSINDVG